MVRCLPLDASHSIFAHWPALYLGNIVYAEALGTKMIIIHDVDIINDLLDRKSSIYSDRPHMVRFHVFDTVCQFPEQSADDGRRTVGALL
jgi:hypothetical protein